MAQAIWKTSLHSKNAFALVRGERGIKEIVEIVEIKEKCIAFYLHVFHVLKEVHVRIMAVGQLDQIPEFRICWECLNEAGKQRRVVLLDAL